MLRREALHYSHRIMNKSTIAWIIGGIVAVLAIAGMVSVLVFATRPSQPVLGAGAVQVIVPTPAADTVVPAPAQTSVPAPTAAPAGATATQPMGATRTVVAEPTVAEPPTAAPTKVLAIPGPLLPARITASNTAPPSKTDGQQPVTYEADNMIDGDFATAWRVPGDGMNQSVRLEFKRPVRVSEIQLVPGYAKIDSGSGTNRFQQNRRIVRVRFVFSGGEAVEQEYRDAPEFQSLAVNDIVATSIDMIILATTSPGTIDPRDFTPVSEILVIGVPE